MLQPTLSKLRRAILASIIDS